MRKTFNLGKVDYYGRGRKINAVDITVELDEEKAAGPVLSVTGGIWNGLHSDIVCGGQCVDEIEKFFKGSKRTSRMVEIWRKYHLNDMNAGTPAQEQELDKHERPAGADHYTWACQTLKDAGLYTDQGYVYGSAWLYRPIPAEILTEIKSWF